MGWKRLAKAGGHGHTVSVWHNDTLPHLYLRHGDEWRALDTSVLDDAIGQAREWSGDLLAGRRAAKGEPLTLGALLRMYAAAVTVTKSRRQQKEDRRRIDIWSHVLGKNSDPMSLTGTQLKSFERQRYAGSLVVPGREIRKVRAQAVRADLAFLNAVFNWAAGMAGGRVLPRNPMNGYRLPIERNPVRPRAYFEDYLALQEVAASVDPLWPSFLALVESLGWRVGAICALQPSDFDPTRTAGRPHGRLLKRAESDKMGVQRWTTLSSDSRAALEDALRVTGKAGSQPLFEKKRRRGHAWDKDTARRLLKRAYGLAEIPEARRVGFHGYRRKWVDERKHLPRADVAAQGAWLSQRTLDIYESPDEQTLLAVAEEPKKLRFGLKT